MFKKKLYYAHSMRIYNTIREKDEYLFIKQTFSKYSIFCPNTNSPDIWKSMSGKQIMQECFKQVKKSKVIVASEYNSRIGKGVFEELLLALKLGKQVLVLRENKLIPIIDVAIVDSYDWAIRYGKIIT